MCPGPVTPRPGTCRCSWPTGSCPSTSWHQKRSGRRVGGHRRAAAAPLPRPHNRARRRGGARRRDPRGRSGPHRGSRDRRRSRLSSGRRSRKPCLRWPHGRHRHPLGAAPRRHRDRAARSAPWTGSARRSGGRPTGSTPRACRRASAPRRSPWRPAQAPRGQGGLPHHREAQRAPWARPGRTTAGTATTTGSSPPRPTTRPRSSTPSGTARSPVPRPARPPPLADGGLDQRVHAAGDGRGARQPAPAGLRPDRGVRTAHRARRPAPRGRRRAGRRGPARRLAPLRSRLR